MAVTDLRGFELDDLLRREWLVVNHLGGYASSTAACLNTRKYHGLLVASMSPPVRRMVLLSSLHETVIDSASPARSWQISSAEYPDTIHPTGFQLLRAFSTDPFPCWVFQGAENDGGWTLEKTLRIVSGANTVVITYTLLSGGKPLTLEVRPLLALRGMHELMYQWNGKLDAIDAGAKQQRIPATSRTPEIFFAHDGDFSGDSHWYLNQIYRRERERGYGGLEDLWNPGVVRFSLRAGTPVHFVCSVEPIDLAKTIVEPDSSAKPVEDETLAALFRAAHEFIVDQPSATIPVAVISNYHWSPPNARDALIAFAGLFLVPRKFEQAKKFLTHLASKLNGGLIPTEFPEDGAAPAYVGADTSLWFIHAVHQYLRYANDQRALAGGLLDVCTKIVDRYRQGTAGLGIACDKSGLIASHVPGTPTSWMDAKVGSWVITPRQGKTVELNALWYNALRIVARWTEENKDRRHERDLNALAELMKTAFNRQFWNAQTNCCYDVLSDGGADASLRPNQILAISLPNAVLGTDRQAAALETIESHLLTPVGLRTLSPDDPSYQGRYDGDVVARDRAYHQGTIYPWLLGPFVSAMLRVRGRSTEMRANALDLLGGCFDRLQQSGQICELFDGDEPHRAGGAIASVRSVGELLRCYYEDILNQQPGSNTPGEKMHLPRPPVHR